MRAVVQRVSRASVTVGSAVEGSIGPGLLVLVGVAEGDTEADAVALADKLAALRIFQDDDGKMNLSIHQAGGEALVISQFTLLADLRRGRRPSFVAAAPPSRAEPLVEAVAERLEEIGIPVATGRFGARMEVALVNEGPVTVVVDVRGGRVR